MCLESESSLGIGSEDLLDRVCVCGGPQIQTEVEFHGSLHYGLYNTVESEFNIVQNKFKRQLHNYGDNY